MVRLSKKAQVASTLSWFVALIVIVIAMVIYFGAVGILVVNKGIDKSTISEFSRDNEITSVLGEEEIDFSKKPLFLINGFIEESKEQIYNFVDSDAALSPEEYEKYDSTKDVDVDRDALEIYQRLYSRYFSYMQDKDIGDSYFYLRNGEKEIAIEKEGGDFSWRVHPVKYQLKSSSGIDDPRRGEKNKLEQVGFFVPLIPGDIPVSVPPTTKYYFITDEGNLFMIMFYEEVDND